MNKTNIALIAKKALLLLFLLLLPAFAAKPPRRIETHHTSIYRLWYDADSRVPVLVAYKLYKGGGDCSRAAMRFRTEPGSASSKDYNNSGFDEGHLANAEDFAYDCEKEREAFTYYNCVPQAPKLNRGVWSRYESITRSMSKNDSVLIVCGPILSSRHKTMGRVNVPVGYFKYAQSLTTCKIYWCATFTNEDVTKIKFSTPGKLQRYCPVKLPLKIGQKAKK